MATPPISLRIPAGLLTLIDARAERDRVSRSQAILDTLGEALAGFEPEALPRGPKAAPKPKRAPAKLVPASALARDRDFTPKLKEASTDQPGGRGIVSGLNLPLGHTRGPMQKGSPKPTKGR